MANTEKAVYEEFSDDNYIDPFDEEDADNERGPIVIVIALITLAALLAVLWVGVNLGRREGQSGPPILRAETSPAKSIPENRGGLQIPHTDKTVFDAINGKQADEPEELLPPPEEPLVLPETAAVSEPVATPEEVAGGSTDVNVAEAQEALTNLIEEQSGPEESPTAAPEETTAALSPPPGQNAPEASAPSTTPSETAPAAEAPEADGELRLEFETLPATEEPEVAAAEPAPVITDPYFVQVTSVRTRNDALVAWDRLEGRFGGLVAGYKPDIQTVDLGNRGIYHRLRVGPLEGRDAAQGLCSQFKQQGQDCLAVK